MLLWVAAVPCAVVALAVAAWAYDVRAADGEALRRVVVAGEEVAGLDRAQLTPVVAGLAERYAASTVTVRTPEGEFEATAAELGLQVDQAATVDAALAEGRDGSLFGRPVGWVASLTADRAAGVVARVDRLRTAAVVSERDPTGRQPAREPGLTATEGVLAVADGADGKGLDANDVADAVEAAAADGVPIEVDVEPETLEPRFDRSDAEALLGVAEAATASPLPVSAGRGTAEIAPAVLRTWVTTKAGPERLELDIDAVQVQDDLAAALSDIGDPPVDAGFDVQGGSVVIVPGQPGTACCGPEAPSLVLAELTQRSGQTLVLPLRQAEAGRTTEEAQALGIIEPIGSFTTNYQAGQSRVVNIHRISDLTRGVVIEPGGTFSVNGFVGRRTRENGFVEGGVIQNGVFEESIGGGISQYATTLFNAAFFAGLEFDEYQSHSIYISRYPRGREATLSYPHPDLIVRNITPHGVLVWPTYTSSSVTVTLYSTRYVTGEQTGQSSSPQGACTRVSTQRTRTWVEDGHTETDSVFAVYRPAEGVNC
jgi:vancomycin resistance protein YoaR